MQNYAIQNLVKIRNDVSALYPAWIIIFPITIIYHVYQAYKTKKTHGQWWSKERSAFLEKSPPHKIHKFNIFALFYRGTIGTLGVFMIFWISKYSQLAGLSPAVILSIQAFSTVSTSILFLILYKERLMVKHIVGMSLIIASIVMIGVAKQISLQSNSTYTF